MSEKFTKEAARGPRVSTQFLSMFPLCFRSDASLMLPIWTIFGKQFVSQAWGLLLYNRLGSNAIQPGCIHLHRSATSRLLIAK